MASRLLLPSHSLSQCCDVVIWPQGTNFNEILIDIHRFSVKKLHLKISSAKLRLFRLGLHELNTPIQFWWSTRYVYNSFYHHHQIWNINLSHCCHIFHGCVPGVVDESAYVVCSYISRESWVLSISLVCILEMCANNRVYYGLRVVSFVYRWHYLIIIIMQWYLKYCIELLKCASKTFPNS